MDAGVDAGLDAGLRPDAGAGQPGTCFGAWCWVQPTPTGALNYAQFLTPTTAVLFGTAGTFITDGGSFHRLTFAEQVGISVPGPQGEFWFPGASTIYRLAPSGLVTTLAAPTNGLVRAADGGLWLANPMEAYLFQSPGWVTVTHPCPPASIVPIGRSALVGCPEVPPTGNTRILELQPGSTARLVTTLPGFVSVQARSSELIIAVNPLSGSTQVTLDGGSRPFSLPEASGSLSFSTDGTRLLFTGTSLYGYGGAGWSLETTFPPGFQVLGSDVSGSAGLLYSASDLFFFGSAASWGGITTQAPTAQTVVPLDGPGPFPRFLFGDQVFDLMSDGGLSRLVTLGSNQRHITGFPDGGFVAWAPSGVLTRYSGGVAQVTSTNVFMMNALAVAGDDSTLLATLNQLFRIPPGGTAPVAIDAGAGVQGFISATRLSNGSLLVATFTQVFILSASGVVLSVLPSPVPAFTQNIESACATADAVYVKTFTELWRYTTTWTRLSNFNVGKLACSSDRAAVVGGLWSEFTADAGVTALEPLSLSYTELRPFYGRDGRLWLGSQAGELLFRP